MCPRIERKRVAKRPGQTGPTGEEKIPAEKKQRTPERGGGNKTKRL